MSSFRVATRCMRSSITSRQLSTSARRLAGPGNAKEHENVAEHRKTQREKPLGPHMTNTTSTITNNMPLAGDKSVPPEFLGSLKEGFRPTDSNPENTKTMTGGTQPGADLEVGELEGGSFRIEPLRREGEDANTMRARLLYQSRKRGTLESDLLMSTFADENLQIMTIEQMQEYGRFMDENDWDIYYWATQEPTPTSRETAEGAGKNAQGATTHAAGASVEAPPSQETTNAWSKGAPNAPRSGEWAQTIGTFKPLYRPVPARWKDSDILKLLRKHVKERSAGGIYTGRSGTSASGKGMAFMPEIKNMDV